MTIMGSIPICLLMNGDRWELNPHLYGHNIRFWPIKLLSPTSWDGNWTHTLYFADTYTTFMLPSLQVEGIEPSSSISKNDVRPIRRHLDQIQIKWPWRDLNPQKLNPKYSTFTNFITRPLPVEGLEPSRLCHTF